MGEIIAITALTLIIVYFGIINYRDREFFFQTISDMNNKLMSRSLTEYAANKSKIEKPPDAPVTSEERLEEIKVIREAGDVYDVGQ